MSKSFKTFLKHTAKDFHNQSVNPPVVRASTIIFKSLKDIRKTQSKAKKNPIGGHYDYGRQGTSTTYILQKILTKLEESYHVFTTPTDFGAVSSYQNETVFMMLSLVLATFVMVSLTKKLFNMTVKG